MKYFWGELLSDYEIQNGLDVPLIPPHLIPKGHRQEWSKKTWSYRLIRGRYSPKQEM